MRGKKQVISIILGTAGLIAFVVALCFVFFGPRALDDNYFIESDRRIVSTMNNPSSKLMYGAEKVHRVYEVSGDKITSYKAYYVFKDAGTASSKLEEIKTKSQEDTGIEKVSVDGKYIILTMAKKTYENSKPEEIRQTLRNQEITTIQTTESSRANTGDKTEVEEYFEEEGEE